MKKEYKHPGMYVPDHNYRDGMHAANKHIRDITKAGTHPGQAQHLGGMASYHNHLEKMHYGPGESIKKDLKRVLDYLFYYSKTDHDIYHFLADDALMHMDQMVSDIEDPKEKEHIRYFVECVREYMHWLKVTPYEERGNREDYGENKNHNYNEGRNPRGPGNLEIYKDGYKHGSYPNDSKGQNMSGSNINKDAYKHDNYPNDYKGQNMSGSNGYNYDNQNMNKGVEGYNSNGNKDFYNQDHQNMNRGMEGQNRNANEPQKGTVNL